MSQWYGILMKGLNWYYIKFTAFDTQKEAE